MSTTKQNRSQETGKREVSKGTDRPEGTVDEDANPPLTDMTKTDVPRNQEPISPQDTESAVPPYEGRQRSSAEKGTPGRGENEQQRPDTGEAGRTAAAHGSGHEHDAHGVGPTHTPGTGRGED
ncbi:MAG TPA: hypothetical protein VGC05_16240 [Mycobacterium sp.]